MHSISFGGAFFGWPYHAGVAAFLQRSGVRVARIYGTSSGAVVATMLACGLDLATTGLELGLRADRRGLCGRRMPFFRPRAFLAPHVEELERHLPDDAHLRASGRLFITMRHVRTWRRVIVSDYASRAALLDALCGAVAVPGLTVALVHRSPRFGAVLDGGPAVPDDDRPDVPTLRIGVHPGPRYHIRPTTPFSRRELLRVGPETERRAMFTRGVADAARYVGTAELARLG